MCPLSFECVCVCGSVLYRGLWACLLALPVYLFLIRPSSRSYFTPWFCLACLMIGPSVGPFACLRARAWVQICSRCCVSTRACVLMCALALKPSLVACFELSQPPRAMVALPRLASSSKLCKVPLLCRPRNRFVQRN